MRELNNAVERALLISDTPEIMPEDLMLTDLRLPVRSVPAGRASPMPAAAPAHTPSYPTTPDEIIPLEEVKHQAVLHAYQLCEGNIEKTAKKLDVSRSTVYRILKKIEEPVASILP